MTRFDEQGVTRVIEYLEEWGDIGKEIMLLFRRYSVSGAVWHEGSRSAGGVICYAEVITLQLHNTNDLMSNSGYVIIMNALGQRKILGNILRYYIHARQVPDLVDEVCARFGGDSCGDYIAICLSPRANENKISRTSKIYTIVRDISDPSDGLTRVELEL